MTVRRADLAQFMLSVPALRLAARSPLCDPSGLATKELP
jgi:hypothetical protein